MVIVSRLCGRNAGGTGSGSRNLVSPQFGASIDVATTIAPSSPKCIPPNPSVAWYATPLAIPAIPAAALFGVRRRCLARV